MRISWRRLGLACAVLALLLALGGLALSYPRYLEAQRRVASLRTHLQTMGELTQEIGPGALRGERLRQMQDELAAARADLAALKEALHPFLAWAPRLGWLPYVGDDLVVLPRLMELGLALTQGAELALKGLEPTADVISLGKEVTLADLAASLSAGDGYLAQAEALLDWANAEGVKLEGLSLIGPQARLLEQMNGYARTLGPAIRLLRAAPELLGKAGPKRYLILAQNNYELRAAGGFISGVGLVEIDGGRIQRLEFGDSYAVDNLSKPHPTPPAPLQELMAAEMWLLRDANWSPDFPQSAQMARELYRLDQGIAVDGVIAVDLEALVLLLRATGPLDVPEFDERVSARDILPKAQGYWQPPPGKEQDEEWWSHRKDFMGAVLKVAIGQLTSNVKELDLTALQEALATGLEGGHIQVWLPESELAGFLHERGWDGSLRQKPGDYLLVVDSNVGFNKVDALIERGITYEVEVAPDGTVSARLTLSYRNNSQKELRECILGPRYQPTYQQMMEGCYWDYLRVYVPEGSHLLSRSHASGPDPEEVLPGRSIFSSYIVVPPGGKEEVSLHYRLPPGVLGEDGRYRLRLEKQAGTVAARVEVSYRLPPGWRVAELEGSLPLEGADGKWHFLLVRDQAIEMRLAQKREFTAAQWIFLGLGMGGVLILMVGVMVRRWGEKRARQ